MDGFFTALLQHTFLQTAVATALLASVGCGIMGSYVVVKRIAFIAGGIAQAYYKNIPEGIVLHVRENLPPHLLSVMDQFNQKYNCEY